jgi:hypothetical protein
MPPMTKSQIDNLGDRLRKADMSSEADLRLLAQLLGMHEKPLLDVERALRERLQLTTQSRLKTHNTIIEKLKRDRTRLSSMQDLAGVRIVQEIGLDGQDALIKSVAELFPTVRATDRRREPSHGYRAVHLIVGHSPLSVEIQVRTVLQHSWAQLVESMADRWGRQMRYGGLPELPEGHFEGLDAKSLMQLLIGISRSISLVENDRLGLRKAEDQLDAARVGDDKYAEESIRIDERLRELSKTEGKLRNMISNLVGRLK